MRPNAAKAGMAPRGASLVALAGLCLATPVFAGDRALIEYLGYSSDGRYFAFEEYGVQDGSGFPYSNIYVIDLPADKWVAGSPYRALLHSEEEPVSGAREAAREQVETKLHELGIEAGAHEIAHNGDGQSGDGHSLTFGMPGYGLQEPQDERTLTLQTFPADSPENCVSLIGEKALGFALLLDGSEVHRDAGSLPKSRGCPLEYRIYAVVTPPEWLWSVEAPVAIVSNYPFGFEGPDRRFLVVPLGE